MIIFFKKLKFGELKRGMTYVELIVVLSIVAVMTSVIMFNYGEFQAKVDMKNLASDIALRVVEAQKSAMSGKLQTNLFTGKPSYGLYFNTLNQTNKTQFIYFADFNNDKIYNEISLETINIQKGNFIDTIETCAGSPTVCTALPAPFSLTITFIRPDSRAYFYTSALIDVDHIRITIKSPKNFTSSIRIYPSGRIQIN